MYNSGALQPKSAEDIVAYRLHVGNYVQIQLPAIQTHVENGLVAQVSNLANGINEVAQVQQAHQRYKRCYEVMHYRTLKKYKK